MVLGVTLKAICMDRPPDFSDSPEGITKGNHQYEVVVLAPWTAILLCLEVLMDVSRAALKAVLCKRRKVERIA